RAAVDEHLQAPGQLAAVHSNRPGKLRGGDRFAVHGQDGIDDRERVVASPGFDARRALAAPDLDADLLGLYGEACAENDDRGRTHCAQRAAVNVGKQKTCTASSGSRKAVSVRQRLMASCRTFLLHTADGLANLALALRLRQVLQSDHAHRLLLLFADEDTLKLQLLDELAYACKVYF